MEAGCCLSALTEDPYPDLGQRKQGRQQQLQHPVSARLLPRGGKALPPISRQETRKGKMQLEWEEEAGGNSGRQMDRLLSDRVC